jgi:glycyl-tRNA synthetase beta chain
VDRELLLEIGCEELPASWLPGLTTQIGEVVTQQLRAHRLGLDVPADTYSTPRRLAVWVARVSERQTDLEEMVNGPSVSASFKPDGTPTQAASGFAARQGVEVSGLERVTTAKGEYLAFRKRQRGKAAVDVLPDVLSGTLRGLSFPKAMHWDATLEDGRGDLLFGRPIRWILFTYGGRVVPFTITRTSAAQSGQVRPVVSSAVTYGHRFLTTTGRAGRGIKVKSFEEYRARLLEHFVILKRSERHDKIARELDAKARRLSGRVSRSVSSESGLLEEVPDLVEYPSVIAGTFAAEFTQVLPDEVLTTTLIHHQHYFPVEDDDGRLKPAFLAVINTEPDDERTIARNAERVVTARLRDAMFFWEADRRTPLDARIDRLSTLTFHKKVGTYKEKAERIERLAEWIAREAFGASAEIARQAAQAARLAKADLATDMVRELTELQGIMGGIYAREEGLPEEVWKAIYFHYLPLSVEADAAPTRAQLGRAAVTWAAVSLADKLDTIVGLYLKAGEKPTGSRDPYGLRRAAQSVVRVLVDLERLTGIAVHPKLGPMLDQARAVAAIDDLSTDVDRSNFQAFLMERLRHLMQLRGLKFEEIQAVTGDVSKIVSTSPADLFDRATALVEERHSSGFELVAEAFKRANNIVESSGLTNTRAAWGRNADRLIEPAEMRLKQSVSRVGTEIERALRTHEPRKAFAAIRSIQPDLAAFFLEVRVMVDDKATQDARLSLLAELRDRIFELGDISVLAPQRV